MNYKFRVILMIIILLTGMGIWSRSGSIHSNFTAVSLSEIDEMNNIYQIIEEFENDPRITNHSVFFSIESSITVYNSGGPKYMQECSGPSSISIISNTSSYTDFTGWTSEGRVVYDCISKTEIVTPGFAYNLTIASQFGFEPGEYILRINTYFADSTSYLSLNITSQTDFTITMNIG